MTTEDNPGATVKTLRIRAEQGLEAPSKRRAALLDQLDEVERELKARILEASDVGLTHRYIAKLVGITDPTISRWVREARQEK